MQVLNKSQSSQLKSLEGLHNAEAKEVMNRLEQESKVGGWGFLAALQYNILLDGFQWDGHQGPEIAIPNPDQLYIHIKRCVTFLALGRKGKFCRVE